MSSDEILWQKLLAGDKKALEQVYASHFDFLYHYGCKWADASIVEDAIQDLFVEIWNGRDKLSPTTSIRPYLTISLKRKIVRLLKKTNRNSSLENFQLGMEDSIEDLLISSENKEEIQGKLYSALDSLTDRQKEIVFLKYYSNLSYEEICSIMEMNYQSARNLLARSIKQLGRSMRLFIHIFWI